MKLAVRTGDYERAPLGRNVNVQQMLEDPRTHAMAKEIYHSMLEDRAARDPNFDRNKAERLGQSLFLSYPARNFVDLCSAATASRLESMVHHAADSIGTCENRE